MKERTYILICIIILFIIFSTAVWLLAKEGFDTISKIRSEDDSKYIIHRTELVPREDITSFCVDNGNIYVFYDETALVNVYGTDGSFKYGIQVSTIRNGRGNITAFDGKLYIESRNPIIFVFQDDQIVESIDFHSDYEKYIFVSELCWGDKTTTDGEYNYQLSESGNDIIRQDTQELVCDLPNKSNIAEDLIFVGLLIIFLAVFGFDKLFRN